MHEMYCVVHRKPYCDASRQHAEKVHPDPCPSHDPEHCCNRSQVRNHGDKTYPESSYESYHKNRDYDDGVSVAFDHAAYGARDDPHKQSHKPCYSDFGVWKGFREMTANIFGEIGVGQSIYERNLDCEARDGKLAVRKILQVVGAAVFKKKKFLSDEFLILRNRIKSSVVLIQGLVDLL